MSKMVDATDVSPVAQRRATYRASAPREGLGSLRDASSFAAIDGLRGIAVLGVLLTGSGLTMFGTLGLDVFFVISGFLVTLMLLRELERSGGRVDLVRYAARRAKRVVPASVLALSGVLVLSWQWGSLEEMQRTATTSILTAAQVANWGQLVDGGPVGKTAGMVSSLGHAWALSLTAQFLIIWPFVMVAVWRLCRGRITAMLGVLAGLTVVAGAVAPLLSPYVSPERILLGTDTRFIAFIVGAAAATALFAYLGSTAGRAAVTADVSRSRAVFVTSVSTLTVVLLAAGGALLAVGADAWLARGGLAAVAAITAVCTLTMTSRANYLSPVLSWAPLATLGRHSFGIFLFHLPVFWLLQRFADGYIPPALLFIGGGIATWLLAVSVHHVVTLPLARVPWSRANGSIAVAVSVSLVAGLALALPADRASAALTPQTSGRPIVLTIGDSLARDFASMLTDSRRQEFGVRDLGREGCGILDDGPARCDDWEADLRNAIEETSPEVLLVHTASDAAGATVNGKRLQPCDPGFREHYREQFAKLLDIASAAPAPPLVMVTNERAATGVLTDKAQLNCFNAVIWDLAADNNHVELLNWNAALCTDGECQVATTAGRPLFRSDDVHLTQVGMTDLAIWLEQAIMAGLAEAKQTPAA